MSRLFISHASEDKDRFVRPLAEALVLAGYKVWYDEYEMTVGDSLRQKIDDGLKRSDYGVVVLSKSFFQKKWTNNELDGLFALEKANRKTILPVWLDVGVDDVASYSSMLAGRLGADGASGVAAVVKDLRRAIEAADRAVEVTIPKVGREKLLAINKKISAGAAESKRLFSIPGSQKVMASAVQIASEIESEIDHVNCEENQQKRFSAVKGSNGTILVRGPEGVFFDTCLWGMAINSARSAEYKIRIGQSSREFPPGSAPAEVLEEMIFKPRMIDDENVTWDEGDGINENMTTAEAASRIIERFGQQLDDVTEF